MMTVGAPRRKRRRFIRHPTWALRVLRHRFRDARLWREQGRPADGIVVFQRGELRVQKDGTRVVYGWGLTWYKRTDAVTVDELWDILAERYPQALVHT